ncbi:hypothetical protein ACFVHB_08730 [Kitasatospora sp. NPDC127111]|uniref:hypothetical protein n=1 Tax=Kitasatospora sp. NPDC127111 TaxID=3345363 RepID=UPI0036266EC4
MSASRTGRGTGPVPGPGGPEAESDPGPVPGSVRHSLIELTATAVLAEVGFFLVGGLPAAGAGAVLLVAVALLTARYVAGAGFRQEGLRRRERLMEAHEPGLGDWRWTVRQGMDPEGDVQPLRGRLQRLFAARLSEAHGLSLPADRDRAAELVGPRLWPWIDPEAPAPAEAVPAPVLLALVDRLESL